MSCGVARRLAVNPALLWLWCRLASVAPIRPLAWKLPCAAGVALRSKKRKEEELPDPFHHPTHLTVMPHPHVEQPGLFLPAPY